MSYETPVAPSLLDLIGRTWTLPGAVTDAVLQPRRQRGRLRRRRPDRRRAARRSRAARDADAPRRRHRPPDHPAAQDPAPPGRRGRRRRRAGRALGGEVVRGRRRARRARLGDAAGAGRAGCGAARRASVGAGARSELGGGGGGGWVGVRGSARRCGRCAAAPRLGQAVTALAYAPDGLLAVGDAGGVTLWVDGLAVQRIGLDAAPRVLAWSPDGAWLAAGFAAPGMALIRPADGLRRSQSGLSDPGRRRSRWSRPAGAFATSGAFRAIAWTLTPEGLGDPVEAGRGGLIVVERVAASPDRPLLAVGLRQRARLPQQDRRARGDAAAPLGRRDHRARLERRRNPPRLRRR